MDKNIEEHVKFISRMYESSGNVSFMIESILDQDCPPLVRASAFDAITNDSIRRLTRFIDSEDLTKVSEALSIAVHMVDSDEYALMDVEDILDGLDDPTPSDVANCVLLLASMKLLGIFGFVDTDLIDQSYSLHELRDQFRTQLSHSCLRPTAAGGVSANAFIDEILGMKIND